MRQLERLEDILGALRVIYTVTSVDDQGELKAMVDVAESFLESKLVDMTETARHHDLAHGVDHAWMQELIDDLRETDYS